MAGNIIRPISIRNGELGRILPAADPRRRAREVKGRWRST
jgi:hypothetical protein